MHFGPTSLCCSAGFATNWTAARKSAIRNQDGDAAGARSEEHTSELQSPCNLVCRLLLEKKKNNALQGVNDYVEKTTYCMHSPIFIKGFPHVYLHNMSAPLDGSMPTAYDYALSLIYRSSL